MTSTAPSLSSLFQVQFEASRDQPEVPLALRRDRVRRVRALIDKHGSALAEAVQADFGVRAPQLTEVADLFVLRALTSQLDSHLPRWMKPARVRTPIYLWPARGRLMRQPLGVVGVISPWNYPLQLALGPAVTAMAAGNRVMLKPSELTPSTSALTARLVSENFDPAEFCVVQGDAHVAAEFAGLPFDHLFFTGSTAVGRKVAEAAARNLTPTTLELGGKSPCIVDPSADLDAVVVKIVHGKLLNAGQTCIAPDYLLLPRGREAEFERAWQSAVNRLFPRLEGNADYAAIVSDRHLARLQSLVHEAADAGARVVEPADPAARPGQATRQMRPVLVFNPPSDGRLMREEIFGPVLPILPCDSVEEAVRFINSRPRPLALYWFGSNRSACDQLLANTLSGGVTVNDTLMHIAHEGLPFGGVGESGWGAYHGETGFLRFTHTKAVLLQSRLAMGHLFYPPYGARFQRVMGLLRRLI
jgi:coniferyl-aldehyde dehydrogenase